MQTANAFMFIPALKGRGIRGLFSPHPPVEDRVRRLREMERQIRIGAV